MSIVIDMVYKVTRDDREVGYWSTYASALQFSQPHDVIEQLIYYANGEIDFRTVNGDVQA